MVLKLEDFKKLIINASHYFSLRRISDETLRAHFPYFDQSNSNERLSYTNLGPNKGLWICHNCGTFGFKYDQINPNFRCYNYNCRSSNVSVYRAGEVSMYLRNFDIGVNMEEFRTVRKEFKKEAKLKQKEVFKKLKLDRKKKEELLTPSATEVEQISYNGNLMDYEELSNNG